MAGDEAADLGCAYLLDGAAGRASRCGGGRRPDSSYCAAHHALCHIAAGSAAERRELEAVEALARIARGRRGSITAGMRQAGEDFRTRFAGAQLDPLRPLDLSPLRIAEPRLRPDNDGPGPRIEAARGTVWRAIQAVGGIASPAGSCLWHVLGWERSLKEWAQGQGWSGRRVSQEA